ncbi:hypothetical protein [Bradyrhizobium sp. RDI18]|uniref:hypothetical protein n=1 Tax=Bradyrhizobium sp. RDI18 TaxID=3367400 RepID=UPI00371D8532
MLMTKERRPAIRTLRGWAISVLQEAGGLRECEEHGWMQERADPQSRASIMARLFDGLSDNQPSLSGIGIGHGEKAQRHQ